MKKKTQKVLKIDEKNKKEMEEDVQIIDNNPTQTEPDASK